MSKKSGSLIEARTFVITYDKDLKLFSLVDDKATLIETGASGKALGKKAWNGGATEVKFSYDLGLDEPEVVHVK